VCQRNRRERVAELVQQHEERAPGESEHQDEEQVQHSSVIGGG
jgi:hypothetical protein